MPVSGGFSKLCGSWLERHLDRGSCRKSSHWEVFRRMTGEFSYACQFRFENGQSLLAEFMQCWPRT
jgi:hypothetical protein